MDVSTILERFLGDDRGHNEGTGQIKFDCPACSAEKGMPEGDGKGNLEINYEKGVFKCWVCKDTHHMYGPVIKLLKKYGTRKIIRDYILLKPNAEYTQSKAKDDEEEDIVVELPKEYKKLSECTSKDYLSDVAKTYLYRRGITDEMIEEHSIGYCNFGEYNNRVIFPSYDDDGVINYFLGRWFSSDFTRMKYKNPTAKKENIIFGESKINWDATIYLVEGVTDHLAVPNSIPLLGKYISNKLLERLHEDAMGIIVIVLDSDAKEDAIKAYKDLNFGDLRGRIRVCTPPDGFDPSSIFERLGGKGVIKLLSNSRKLENKELF